MHDPVHGMCSNSWNALCQSTEMLFNIELKLLQVVVSSLGELFRGAVTQIYDILISSSITMKTFGLNFSHITRGTELVICSNLVTSQSSRSINLK